ncbi:hypothetical protein AB0L65_30220 [Nonomuraea sp. NPDC052116]|uniref:pentapeptide repeat-containing protein n=1 Tax=Nonomuraea sp. NPDC052116 TaxID=3155665 RepID=UPI003420142C
MIALALTGSILLASAALVIALWLIGFPALSPPTSGLSLTVLLDLVKISFGVTAGAGAVIAVIVAYRRQKVVEAAELRAEATEQREVTKLFNERYSSAGEMLGHDSPAVRLAAIQALAALADDAPTHQLRQMVIDVLCAYLRMPQWTSETKDIPQADRIFIEGHREVRHAIIRAIASRLQEGTAVSWKGHDLDLTRVVFDGGDFSGAVFSARSINFSGAMFTAGRTSFARARFASGNVGFNQAKFSGGEVEFTGAEFEDCNLWFHGASFEGAKVYFNGAKFRGGITYFNFARFISGSVNFQWAELSGGVIDFHFAEFQGSSITLDDAKFMGAKVTFLGAKDWSTPPSFPKHGTVGLILPKGFPDSSSDLKEGSG